MTRGSGTGFWRHGCEKGLPSGMWRRVLWYIFNWLFGVTSCCPSVTSGNFYQITRHHTQEDILQDTVGWINTLFFFVGSFFFLFFLILPFLFLHPPSSSQLSDSTVEREARGGVVVKALRYKPAGRGFDSRWCHWNFSVTTLPSSCAVVMKSGNLNFWNSLGHSRPVTALPLPLQ